MFSYLVYVSISTMAKIVIGVLAGVFISPHLSAPIESEKGLSFITLRVLLSAMLFSNVCFDVSLTLLSKYYWAVIMSLVPMLVGGFLSLFCTKLVSREYRCLVVLGSTFQNGLVFPLTVVTSIKGVAWLDDEAVRHCQQFVFLYNLTCALGLWSIGSPMVKHYKDKFANEKIEAEAEADYLASLLAFYRRVVHREASAKAAQPISGDASLSDDRIADATASTVRQLQEVLREAHSTAHTSLRDMTVLDVLSEFMYRVRAARGGASAGGSGSRHTAAVLMPPHSKATDVLDSQSGESRTADGTAHPEVGACVEPGSPASPTLSTAKWITPDDDASPPPSTTTAEAARAPATTRPSATEAADDDGIPTTDAGRQLVLYRPLSGAGKMRPIDMTKYDVWESRQQKQHLESVRAAGNDNEAAPRTEMARVTRAKRSTALNRDDVGPGASPLFTPPEDLYQEPYAPTTDTQRRIDKSSEKRKGPFVYAYVSTIGNLVHGACGGSDSSEEDEVDGAGLPRNMQLRERDRPCGYRFRKFLRIAKGAFQTMPVWATLLAICISLIPPLRWLAETIPFAMVIQGLHIVGDGCVPVQLVVLGCTLATKRLMDPLVWQRTDEEMRMREMRAPETLVQRLTLKKLRDRVFGSSRASTNASRTMGQLSATAEKLAGAAPHSGSPTTLQGEHPVDPLLIVHAKPLVDIESRAAADDNSQASGDWLNGSATTALDLLATESLSGAYAPPGQSSSTGKRWTAWDRVPSATRLAIIVMALRLLIVPAISFLLVHVLMTYKIMPTDRPFVVSILIGISSPAAVNSSLACTMHGYHADEYSRVMFVMHVAAVVTSTFWLVVSITYTEKMGTDLYR